jgi:hypothetical protein
MRSLWKKLPVGGRPKLMLINNNKKLLSLHFIYSLAVSQIYRKAWIVWIGVSPPVVFIAEPIVTVRIR